MTIPTKSQEAAADVAALLRARNPLIWIKTTEEARVEGYIFEAAASAKYLARTWDIAQCVAEIDGQLCEDIGAPDPGATFTAIWPRSGATDT